MEIDGSNQATGAGSGASGAEPHPNLGAATRGDRAAQQELLLAYIDRIRRRVTRLVGPAADADDLVQQSCVELLRSLASYRGDASLKLWVDRITTHVVYKHFRSTKRRRRRLIPAQSVDLQSSVDSERHLAWRRGIEDARQIIAELRPARRIVFLLVAVEGRTLPEAAAMLDLSLAAAKSRYLRARRDVDRAASRSVELSALFGREEAGHG